MAQYSTLEKQYQLQVDSYNEKVGATKKETSASKTNRPIAGAAPMKAKPVAQRNKEATKSTTAPVPTKDASSIKEIDIQPTRTLSKEKLRSFLERAWKFLENEDSKKIFLNQV